MSCLHAQVSTIKYTLIKTFLQLRYNVLITDMDLVYFSNPFDHLKRRALVTHALLHYASSCLTGCNKHNITSPQNPLPVRL